MLSKKVVQRVQSLGVPAQVVNTLRVLKQLTQRSPLSNQGSLHIQPVLIIGSGRSGNTLLRAILVAQGQIAIPPESYVLGALIHEYQIYNFLPWSLLARLIISRFESHPQFIHWSIPLTPVYQQCLALEADHRTLADAIDVLYQSYATSKQVIATRWGDKTPLNTLHLDAIRLVFPNAQYIHMLRDGRDVVQSYIQSGIYQEADEAADRWLMSVDNAHRLQSNLPASQFLELRYEKLVLEPRHSLEEVCQFLGISYSQNMLEFWKSSENLGDTSLEHHANVRNPINRDSIGKWKTNLSEEIQARLSQRIGAKLRELEYL